MPNTDLAVVATFATTIEAAIAQGALKAAGIQSIISSDNAGGQYPGICGDNIRLLVQPADLRDAQMILGTPAAWIVP